MSPCVFCNIVADKVPASVVFEDEACLAFIDIQPVNAGHVLVIPKEHVPYLADLDPEVGGRMFKVAQRLAQALRGSSLRCEGVNLFLADGEAAGQDVFHVHLHVFPRYKGDGFGLRFGPSYGTRPSRMELDRIAAMLRKQLQEQG
jgi:histidine triad (HIT) family protein